jgi:hypothetical protein
MEYPGIDMHIHPHQILEALRGIDGSVMYHVLLHSVLLSHHSPGTGGTWREGPCLLVCAHKRSTYGFSLEHDSSLLGVLLLHSTYVLASSFADKGLGASSVDG